MDRIPESEARRSAGVVKMETAALVLGAPFYALVTVLLLQGAAQLMALALYGVGAGGWVVWRTRRALGSGSSSAARKAG